MLLKDSSLDEFDPLASDLFSIAMCILEASTLGRLPKIYSKQMINYDTLKLNLKRCPYEKLREKLSALLLEGVGERQACLERLQGKMGKK